MDEFSSIIREMETNPVLYEKYDDKGRLIGYLDRDGWGFTREYDDDWNKHIPAHVVETMHGKIIYERHYDDEMKYSPNN